MKGISSSSYFIFYLLVIYSIPSIHATAWDQSKCRFTTDDGGIIDISSLHINESYYTISDSSSTGYNYHFNFCPNLGVPISSCVATDIVSWLKKCIIYIYIHKWYRFYFLFLFLFLSFFCFPYLSLFLKTMRCLVFLY